MVYVTGSEESRIAVAALSAGAADYRDAGADGGLGGSQRWRLRDARHLRALMSRPVRAERASDPSVLEIAWRGSPSGSVVEVFREDVETLRGAYQAFNEGGVEAILERLAPGVSAPRPRKLSRQGGTRYGKEGIKQLFDSYMEAFD